MIFFFSLTRSLILLFLLSVLGSVSQNRIISGVIKDKKTKTPLAYCNIIISKTTIGTTSNHRGEFNLVVHENPEPFNLIVAYIGYKQDTLEITAKKNEYTIYLVPLPNIMDEIVITGVSKATLIAENPVSILSISTRVIEQASENNIIDVLSKNAPGLNSVKTGPNISKPFIRGLGYNRVLTLYDGLRQEGQQWGDEHGIEIDGYLIEKAEVIKGPSSLIYGSDALAGVISLIPVSPKNTDKKIVGKFFSEYQSNNGLVGNGLHLGYGTNRWSYLVNGSYRIAKNYQNAIDGRVYNTNFKEANISGGIAYSSKKGTSNLNFTLYENFQGIPDGSRDSSTRKFTKQIFEGEWDTLNKRPILSNRELNSYQLSPLHQHIQHYRLYSNNTYFIGKGDIDLLLAIQKNVRREYNHPTQPKQAGMFVNLASENFSLRYNSPKLYNIEISIGANGMHQKNSNKNATDFPIPNYQLFDFGTYVFAKWKHKKWTISGGVRNDIRFLESGDFYLKTDSVSGFDKAVTSADTIGGNLQFPAFSKTYKGNSFSFGLTYQITHQISVKANIAKGYRSPSINEIASNGLDPGAHILYLGNRGFIPEFSLQEDIGISFTFKQLSASLGLFNNRIQNYIYLSQLSDAFGNAIISNQGNKTYHYQQSSAHLYGLEASFDWHPKIAKGFTLISAFSLVNGYNQKAEYKNKGINGEYLPLMPPMKLISSANQQIALKTKYINTLNFKFEADYSAAQHRYLALNKTETFTPSYLLLNAAIATELNYLKNIRLQFQVNNILNTSYQSNLGRLKYLEYYHRQSNESSGIYGMGRNLCVKLIMAF